MDTQPRIPTDSIPSAANEGAGGKESAEIGPGREDRPPVASFYCRKEKAANENE